MLELIYLFIAALFSYIIKGITGFGNTLLMTPLFSFILDNQLITPIDLLFSIPINSYIVYKNRKNLSLKIVTPLSIMLLIGVIPGTLLLKTGNALILKIILGVVIIGLAVELITRKPSTTNQNVKPNKVLLTLIGVASGVLAGLYGIAVLLVAYISRTTNGKGQFRANLCAVFLIDNLFRLYLYLNQGILTQEAVKLTLYLFPAVIIGMFIGIKVDKHLSDKVVHKLIVIVLVVSGISLITTNLITLLK